MESTASAIWLFSMVPAEESRGLRSDELRELVGYKMHQASRTLGGPKS